ncbi:MAG: SDR family oxidoreductase [Vicinamibacteria bacterium]|jgi:short-subunit dehydrogenase|nr:SDR family oxidoreductase [Vicinamibacteria bacterium]
MAEKDRAPVVFITGASSGIGAELARIYALRGARLVLTARRLDRLQELCGEIQAQGGAALAVLCDVTRDGDLARAIAAAVERFGRIDTVIANAGFGVPGRLDELTLDDYRRQFETNVFGLIRTAQAALPELRKSRGRLALIGSVAGYVTAPGTSAYGMSKFAVRALAQALRVELRRDGVSVTHIAPGMVASEFRLKDKDGRLKPGAQDPTPRWLIMATRPAARQIVRAIESRRRERIITGHGRVIVWLTRYAPWFVDLVIERANAYRKRGAGVAQ